MSADSNPTSKKEEMHKIFGSLRNLFHHNFGAQEGRPNQDVSFKFHKRRAVNLCQRSRSEPDLMRNAVVSMHPMELNESDIVVVDHESFTLKSVSLNTFDKLLAKKCPPKAAKTLGLRNETLNKIDKLGGVQSATKKSDNNMKPLLKSTTFSISSKSWKFADTKPVEMDAQAVAIPSIVSEKAAKTLGLETMELSEKAAKRLGIPIIVQSDENHTNKTTEDFLKKIGAFTSENKRAQLQRQAQIHERLSAAKMMSENKTYKRNQSTELSEETGNGAPCLRVGDMKPNMVTLIKNSVDISKKRRIAPGSSQSSPNQTYDLHGDEKNHLHQDMKFQHQNTQRQENPITQSEQIGYICKSETNQTNRSDTSLLNKLKQTIFENHQESKWLTAKDAEYLPKQSTITISSTVTALNSPKFVSKKMPRKCESEAQITSNT